MNVERTEKCEMLKSELSQLALVLESNQVFAEPINPITGEYLIRFVREAICKWFVSDLIPKKVTKTYFTNEKMPRKILLTTMLNSFVSVV